MKKSQALWWIAFVVINALFSWGCATSIRTSVLAPARAHDAAKFTRAAVLPFSGPEGKLISNNIEALMASVQVHGRSFYNIVERAEIEKVAKENKFQMSDLVNQATAQSLGKLLGAQAIVVGSVSRYATEDKHYKEGRSKCVSKDKKGNCKWRDFTVSCRQRTATIQFTPKIINVETGSIAASEIISGQASHSACSDSGTPLKGNNELLDLAMKSALEQYRTFVAPHQTNVKITLITSDNSKMNSQAKDAVKDGVTWAKADRLDRACECWNRAALYHKKGYAIPYLIGVCYETKGELQKAQHYYKIADEEATEPVEELSAALERVQDRIQKEKVLFEQLEK